MSLDWADAVYKISEAEVSLAPLKGQRETRIYMLELDGETLQEITETTDLPQIGDPHPDVDDYDKLTDVEVKSVSIEVNPTAERAHITVEYAPIENANRKNVAGEVWEWGLATQQQHITSVSKLLDTDLEDNGPQVQFHFRDLDPDPPNGRQRPPIQEGRGIGVDGDTVEGTDIYAAAISLKITKEWEANAAGDSLLEFWDTVAGPPTTITFLAFLARIASGLGTVDYTGTQADGYTSGVPMFTGFHTLFTGTSNLGRTDRGKWGVTYEFLLAQHPTDPGVGEMTLAMIDYSGEVEIDYLITGVKGWDYLWYTVNDKQISNGLMWPNDITTNKNVIMEAHLARVYPEPPQDFKTLLGIQGAY